MNNINVPSHIAIIMDGNGRWAKERALNEQQVMKKELKQLEILLSLC